jgi:hypothetical protein
VQAALSANDVDRDLAAEVCVLVLEVAPDDGGPLAAPGFEGAG